MAEINQYLASINLYKYIRNKYWFDGLLCLNIPHLMCGENMSKYKELLGSRIRQLRKRDGLSQEKLAELIGIDPNSVSRIECGVHYPSLDMIEKFAAIFMVEMRDLFLFSDQESPEEMRAFLIRMASEADVEKLRNLVRVVREVI